MRVTYFKCDVCGKEEPGKEKRIQDGSTVLMPPEGFLVIRLAAGKAKAKADVCSRDCATAFAQNAQLEVDD